MIININGAKNSSLSILSSCLLCKDEYKILNIPNIKDIHDLSDLMRQFNINIVRRKKTTIINTKELCLPKKLKYKNNFRGSYYLIGATSNMITDNFKYEISKGCEIGKRPINYHIDFLEKFGYKVISENKHISVIYTNNVNKKETLYFKIKKKSVGTTINSIILSVKSNKVVYLENYSKEPYIFDTVSFLVKMGAKIEITDIYIKIIGKQILNSCNYKIMYDPIEMGTYIIIAAILQYKNLYDNLIIGPLTFDKFGKFNNLLHKIGILCIKNNYKENYYTIGFNSNISDIDRQNINIETGCYPEIYTDLQPLIVLLLSELNIISSIKENVWEDRFKYINELNKLGHNISTDKNTIYIKKKNQYNRLHHLNCCDLRGDASLLIASLFSNCYHKDIIDLKFINRGYFDLNKNIFNIYNTIKQND